MLLSSWIFSLRSWALDRYSERSWTPAARRLLRSLTVLRSVATSLLISVFSCSCSDLVMLSRLMMVDVR
ncbi:hypothetical protein D3C85_1581210 [compost metagenome]